MKIILPDVAWRAGRKVVFVDPKGTSQRCARCGEVVQKSLSERVHRCPECGFEVHRDTNAALNILSLGLEQARGQAESRLIPAGS